MRKFGWNLGVTFLVGFGAISAASDGPLDREGLVQCASKFSFFSEILGKQKEATLKQPTKIDFKALGSFDEPGPSFSSKLFKQGVKNEVDYYSNRFGVRVHSDQALDDSEEHDLIFGVSYNHFPDAKKSKSREVHLSLELPSVEAPSQYLFHVVPGQGIRTFRIKPGEGLKAGFINPPIPYSNKKYKDEVLKEVSITCTLHAN